MLALGGFIEGSVVIIWGVLAPTGALLCGNPVKAKYWFGAYILTIIFSGIIQPYLTKTHPLPEVFVFSFFVINISVVSAINIITFNYFVKQKDLLIEIMKKNRELEQAYLQQEVTMRQNEKLATLGKLSAGITHELNNPASAALRSAEYLNKSLSDLENNLYKLGVSDLSEKQLEAISHLKEKIFQKNAKAAEQNLLMRNKFESELETWCETRGLKDNWELISIFAEKGIGKSELEELADLFTEEQFPIVAASLESIFTTHNLTEEIREGTSRITQIVNALKSYIYLDQAPVQMVDINEGLENTLLILAGRLKNGITISRDFSKNIPRIAAYGSELNQVWTNIIDNALDAMHEGEISIKTYGLNGWIVVEIKDSGPGIPDEIQSKIFDPFFTTKPQGQGTGLGLNISHNIITQKHKGEISVSSRPGETCFMVKLPINQANLS
jgi:signal transduction histidine kinase